MRTLFFLHVPKCAGMSLMNALLDRLPAGEVYQSTSMIRNFRENRPEFPEITDHGRLKALIGHWLHEDMLPFLSGYLLFATSLRDPIERVRSQYRFDVGIRGGVWARQDTATFLKANRNVICNFLTRAFPSIAADHDDPAEAAKAILSGMDCVFDIARADENQKHLLAQVGFHNATILRTNTSGHVAQQLDVRDDDIAEHCRHDIALHDWFRARAAAGGSANPRNPVFDQAVRDRFAALRTRPANRPRLLDHIARHYAAEIHHGTDDPAQAAATLGMRQQFATALLNAHRRLNAPKAADGA